MIYDNNEVTIASLSVLDYIVSLYINLTIFLCLSDYIYFIFWYLSIVACSV